MSRNIALKISPKFYKKGNKIKLKPISKSPILLEPKFVSKNKIEKNLIKQKIKSKNNVEKNHTKF